VLIYLAGPPFSEAERRFNLGLTHRLEAVGFDVFLPRTVLSRCPDRDGFALATLDLDYLDRFRQEFPALKNRRPEAYDW